MAKAYFTIAGLFQDVQVDNGQTVKLELQTIKVGGVEQLTSDFFTEVTPTFVNPHNGVPWSVNNCTQTGVYPNTTSQSSCSLLGTQLGNSYNPFRSAFLVNYSTLPASSTHRGEIIGSVSTSFYGLEPFLFGFDNIDTPINDLVTGGSSGATVQGAFYLDIDYSQDFEMVIEVQIKSAQGAVTSAKVHTYSHVAGDCDFSYIVTTPDSTSNAIANSIGVPLAITGGSSIGSAVDAGNGFIYTAPLNDTKMFKVNEITGAVTVLGGFPIPPDKWLSGEKAPNGKIYFAPLNYDTVLVLDPLTDTTYTIPLPTSIGNFRKWQTSAMTTGGIMYCPPCGHDTDTILKIDTNTDTVTEFGSILPHVGVNPNIVDKYTSCALASNGFIYCFNAGAEPFLKINTIDDSLTFFGNQGTDIIKSWKSYEYNGVVYGISSEINAPPPYNIIKIDTANSDAVTKIPFIGGIDDYRDSILGADGFFYLIPMKEDHVKRYNPIDDSIVDFPFLLINPSWIAPVSLSNGNIIAFPNFSGAVNSLMLQVLLTTKINPLGGATTTFNSINSTQTAFLSGGLSGWIVPDCGAALEPGCDPIVSQALGVVPPLRTKGQQVFDRDFIKSCCYFAPVLAHLTDTESFKNDYNSFVTKTTYGSASETITMVLLKNGGVAEGGVDIPLIDNTYGRYIPFNFYGSGFGIFGTYKGYQIEWQKVLQVEGTGTYQFQTTLVSFGVTTTQVSVPFVLKPYTNENAKGTVRIESFQNGYLKHLDFDYGKFNWKDSTRFRGFFGNNQPEYEEERIIYTNRQAKQLRSEMTNNYVLQSMRIPSCITQPIIDYHNFANSIKITDYNPVNHRDDYEAFEVIFDSVESIEYHSVTNNAVLNLKYKDYFQDYTKSNC